MKHRKKTNKLTKKTLNFHPWLFGFFVSALFLGANLSETLSLDGFHKGGKQVILIESCLAKRALKQYYE